MQVKEKREKERDLVGNILSVGLCHNRILIEDIVNELWSDSDPDFSSFDGFRSRVNKLT